MPYPFAAWIGGPFLSAIIIMGILTFNALFLIWLERKVSARIQRRMGPMEVGWHGTAQTAADALKLLSKQLITPRGADKPLYHLAPVVVLAPVVATVSLFPYGPQLAFHNLDLGLVLVFMFGGLSIIGIFMAGWGSNNKYALLGAMRSVAQNISYEIPLILSALAVVLMANAMSPIITIDGIVTPFNGMNLSHMVRLQADRGYPLFFLQPVAALIFFIAALAETNRAPFDIPEAESELVAGFHTEYSGMRFAMFFFAEYSHMFIVSMVSAVLFFGGWHGPFQEYLGWLWFFLKTYALVFAMMWMRWTFPRLRFDQLMSFCWTVLIPFSIVNLLVTALLVKVF